jgi:predicted transcriptional regulator
MANEEIGEVSKDDLLRFSTDIVASYVGRNTVSGEGLPGLINTVFSALNDLDGAKDAAAANSQKPAVSIRRSVTSDHLICLEDGKKLKMLKRYIRTNFSMTPDEYRAKWGLPHDYPMVAPNYAKQRSEFAKTIGLGRNGSRRRIQPA